MEAVDVATWKHIFALALRWGDVEGNYAAISLTCKRWHVVLCLLVADADSLRFNQLFGAVLRAMVHNFDRPCFESYFGAIVRCYSEQPASLTDIVPVDHCTCCGKLRCVFRDNWCDCVAIGCQRWVCAERVDAYADRCHCCPWKPTEQMVLDRAYFLYMKTGRTDALANYYEALSFYD